MLEKPLAAIILPIIREAATYTLAPDMSESDGRTHRQPPGAADLPGWLNSPSLRQHMREVAARQGRKPTDPDRWDTAANRSYAERQMPGYMAC
jgi:hypothetical protein